MAIVVNFIKEYAAWAYGACALVALWYLRVVLLARRERRTSVFNLERETACEGKYIIQTEEKDLTPEQAVRVYKELNEVERGFDGLKDVLELRPVFHQTEPRVRAHVFVATLALLLHRALEKKLKAHGLDLSATDALQALRTVRVVDLALADGTMKQSVTRGSQRAEKILRALGIANLMPCQRLDHKEVDVAS